MSANSSSNPPLPDWIEDHRRRYLETNGEDGHVWNGITCLLLTTTGRKSGEQITLPLIYGEKDGRYVVIGSKGGAPDHPSWYKNLVAEPEVEVQVAADRFTARARTAEGDEREELWKMMAGIFPNYTEYQERTARQIPVVVLERA